MEKSIDYLLTRSNKKVQNLYDFLKRTGRYGIIVSQDIDDGVSIIGNHNEEEIGKENREDGVKITRYRIIMNGREMGILEVKEDEEGVYSTFEPAVGVNVYDDEDLEDEMKKQIAKK